MWLKKLLNAGQALLSFWVVALGLVLGLGAIVAAVAIPIAVVGAALKYTPLSSVPGINYITGFLVLLLVWKIVNKVGIPSSWKNSGTSVYQVDDDDDGWWPDEDEETNQSSTSTYHALHPLGGFDDDDDDDDDDFW